MKDTEFINNRYQKISSLENLVAEFYRQYSVLFPDLIDESILSFEDKKESTKSYVNTEFESFNKKIEEKINLSNEQIQNTHKKILDELEKKEISVKESIKRTAKKIVMNEAQQQFMDAKKHYRNLSLFWGILSGLLICTFVYVSIEFYKDELNPEYLSNLKNIYGDNFSEVYKWNSIYHTILRISLLFIIGACTTFCLKIFRANMHMYNHNAHRLRLTMSIEALINAANTDEQSDKILEHLVEAIVSFGNSGLISNDDDNVQLSKMTIDNISRTISPK